MISEDILAIWEDFRKMSDKEKIRTAEEIMTFFKEHEKLDREISSWWDEESRRMFRSKSET